MIQERKFPTILTQLTPSPKLWLALGLTLTIVLVKNIHFALALIALSIILIIHEKKMGLFVLVLVTLVVLFCSMYGIYGTIAPVIDKSSDPVLFNVLGVNYYAKGLLYASNYYLKVAPLMCSLFLIFLTIDITDLGVTMCNAGIPYNFVFTFIDSFQVIIMLNKDMEQIRDAQRARGLNTEGNLIQRFKAFVPIIVPVVANAIIKVQDQAVAMDTKGFNSTNKKTVYREIVPCKWDPLVKWVGISMAAFSIIYVILSATRVISPVLTNITY